MGVGQAGPAAADGAGDGVHGGVLADHPLRQERLHAQQLGHLALHEPANGHPGPLAHHLGHVFLVDLFLEHLAGGLQLGEPGRRLGDLALEVRELAVADLGRPGEVAIALEALGVEPAGFHPFLERADAGDGLLLRRPVRLHGR